MVTELIQSRSVARARRVPYNCGTSQLPTIVLLAVLAGVLCVLAAQSQFQSGLRSHVYARLVQMFPNARIKIGKVTAHGSSGIVVHDVHFGILDAGKTRRIVSIDHVTLRGDLDISNWVQQTVRIRTVELHQPRMDLWQAKNSQWSLAALNCVKVGSEPSPDLIVRGGELRIFRDHSVSTVPVVCHDIQCILKPVENPNPNACPTLSYKLTARSSGTCDSIQLAGHVCAVQKTWDVHGDIVGLNFSQDLVAKLPQSFEVHAAQLRGLSCKADARIEAKVTTTDPVPDFRIFGLIKDGRLQDPRLPYPLEDLCGQFSCKRDLLQLRNLSARSGESSFEVSTDIFGLHLNAPMTVRAKAEQLQLDARLYNSLPRKWRDQWDRIQPHGLVDAEVSLTSDGQTWTPIVTVNCRDVQVECWLFPYPLSKLTGIVEMTTNRITCINRMQGEAAGQTIVGGFDFLRQNSEWYGKLDVSIHGSVAIDEKLLSALTVRGQPKSTAEKFVRSLDPSGSFILHKATFERRTDDSGIWHKSLDIQIVDSSMLYAYFSYPLYDIRGRIKAEDDLWRLEKFEGRNDSGRITCDGEWLDQRSAGIPFQLNFLAHSVPMEEELQRALPADARQLWEEIQPSGTIDRTEVVISRSNGTAPIDIKVALHENTSDNTRSGQSLRLHPRSFPYWLSDVACDIEYRAGTLDILQASASNGGSRVALQANCWKSDNGTWAGAVKWLPNSRIMVDTQLLRALPDSISEGLIQLDLRGPVSVLGQSRFQLPADPREHIATDFDLRLNLERVQLGDGKYVDGICGEVALRGERNAAQLSALGSISIDAMSVKGIPVTRMNGPFAIVGNELLFGSNTASRMNTPETIAFASREITADALSGTLRLNGQGQLDTGRFAVSSKLENADLRLLLQDLGASQVPTDALCQVEMSVSGIPSNSQTYTGNGKIHLSDAELYQLPMMVKLMRVLSVTPTDNAAFHTADVTFQIDGDRIPLQLACEGDVLSLRGSGWTNLRRELSLELYSYVGRRVPLSSVLTPILPESRYATFMMFEIDGTLDNPQVNPRAFPQLEAVQQQMFPDKVAGEVRQPRAMLGGFRRVLPTTREQPSNTEKVNSSNTVFPNLFGTGN